MNVIDNFLEKNEFEYLKNSIIYNGTLPWHTNIGVSNTGGDDGWFLYHMFYERFQKTSEHFNILFPILERLNPVALIRIKANFYPSTSKIIHQDFHVDFLDVDNTPLSCKGCLFYMNSNNGKTIFKDGTEIDSVENRVLLFNPGIEHKGTTCTDDFMGRFVINFNYF